MSQMHESWRRVIPQVFYLHVDVSDRMYHIYVSFVGLFWCIYMCVCVCVCVYICRDTELYRRCSICTSTCQTDCTIHTSLCGVHTSLLTYVPYRRCYIYTSTCRTARQSLFTKISAFHLSKETSVGMHRSEGVCVCV